MRPTDCCCRLIWVLPLLSRKLRQRLRPPPESYKEMSSILADQKRPRNSSPNCGGRGGVAWSHPMSTAVHTTWHGAQINFGDLPPYLTYGHPFPLSQSFYSLCSREAGGGAQITHFIAISITFPRLQQLNLFETIIYFLLFLTVPN